MSDTQLSVEQNAVNIGRTTADIVLVYQSIAVMVSAYHQKCPPELMAALEYSKNLAKDMAVQWHQAMLHAEKVTP